MLIFHILLVYYVKINVKIFNKCLSSLSYSISSSGSSIYWPEFSDNDSEATFDGFEPLTEDDQNKLAKIGKLRMVEYGHKKRKCVRSYICHEGGYTFVERSICELNEHHVQ